VGQNLVDDHLKEQRRDECKDLHEERRQKDVRQRSSIAPQGRQEPGDAERARVGAFAPDFATYQNAVRCDLTD